MTKKSITKVGAYRVDLTATRERGYATDYEEQQEGINGISARVFDAREQVIGALSSARPIFRMAKNKTRLYGKECAELAVALSAKLR